MDARYQGTEVDDYGAVIVLAGYQNPVIAIRSLLIALTSTSRKASASSGDIVIRNVICYQR